MFNYQQKVKGMLRLSNPSLPAPLPFLSSPSAFKGHGWPSLASNSRVQVNRQSQYPWCWAPEDWRQTATKGPFWNTAIRGARQEVGKKLKNQWQVSRLLSQQELRWGFWHAVELRLHKHWLVLMEPLPGEVTTWLQGSLGKQRGDSHGKENPHVTLYAMNFCKCFTAFYTRRGCSAWAFCSAHWKTIWKKLRKPWTEVLQVTKTCKYKYNMQKNPKLLSSCHLQSERWKHKTIVEMHFFSRMRKAHMIQKITYKNSIRNCVHYSTLHISFDYSLVPVLQLLRSFVFQLVSQ